MKTLILSLILIIFSFSLNAQIPNPSFENWSGNSPEGWWSNSDEASGIITVSKSTDAQSGSSAIKLEVASFMGIDVGPLLSSGSADKPGFSISQKYETLSGYYKFTSPQNDIFSIVVTMKSNSTVIGEGILEIAEEESNYTHFSVDISYSGDSDPDSCYIYFLIEANDPESAPHSGSYAVIDNISFNLLTTEVENLSLPLRYTLSQNYPNPFNPETTINFSIPDEGFVSLKIFDSLGQEKASLVNDWKPAGSYKINFNASHLSSGVYFYKLESAGFKKVMKMILLK